MLSVDISSCTDNSNEEMVQRKELPKCTSLTEERAKYGFPRVNGSIYFVCISKDSNCCWHEACSSLYTTLVAAPARL